MFWIAFSYIIYTYAVYPLIIVIVSILRKKPHISDENAATLPTITMIIIAFNEETGILDKIENCRELDYPRDLLTVCIVSDGSTDRTNEIIEGCSDILFIRDEINRGKPYQINRAVERSDSDIIVFSDSRQIYGADALRKLVRNFADPDIGAVSGELVFRSAEDHTERSIGLYWRYEKILRKAESDVDSTLGVSGSIYAIRRELVEQIPEDTILDDIEIPLRAFRKGFRVIFDSEAEAFDTASTELVAEFKRKSRTLAGNFQLFDRNAWLLNPFENRIFFQAVSHKLFRLFVPYALCLVLIASYVDGHAALKAFFAVQMLFYLAGIAAVLSEKLRTNRIMNFIAVFLSLNAASVAALYKYTFRKADVRWKN
jgi:cellulose synthase/poly-beta-1,6-N-acetylglucosamine synthase-like glycosyltransferase